MDAVDDKNYIWFSSEQYYTDIYANSTLLVNVVNIFLKSINFWGVFLLLLYFDSPFPVTT